MGIIIISRRTLVAVGLGLLLVSGLLGYRGATSPVIAEIPQAALMPQGRERPIYSAKTEEKVAALTFDISWGTKMYPKVLQVLQDTGTPATFFLSGPWSSKHPEAVSAVKAGGHEIESHGQAHVNFNELSRVQVGENIQAAHQILQDLAGVRPTFIRPPNGAFDDEAIQAGRDLGYQTVIWSVDSLDWKNPGVGTITSRVLKKIHPGAIILMHASDSCKQTDQALPAILAGLKAQGYKLVPLAALLGQYGVDPGGHIH